MSLLKRLLAQAMQYTHHIATGQASANSALTPDQQKIVEETNTQPSCILARLDYPARRVLNADFHPNRYDFKTMENVPAPGHHTPGYHARFATSAEDLDLMRQVREAMERDIDGAMFRRIGQWLQAFDDTLDCGDSPA